MTMEKIMNVVFDLGGVVFARDPRKFEPEFIKFFSYILRPKMPEFWEEYDRGVVSYEEVILALAAYNSCDVELARKNLERSILTQEQLPQRRHSSRRSRPRATTSMCSRICRRSLSSFCASRRYMPTSMARWCRARSISSSPMRRYIARLSLATA